MMIVTRQSFKNEMTFHKKSVVCCQHRWWSRTTFIWHGPFTKDALSDIGYSLSMAKTAKLNFETLRLVGVVSRQLLHVCRLQSNIEASS
jgi:hypothetical protein